MNIQNIRIGLYVMLLLGLYVNKSTGNGSSKFMQAYINIYINIILSEEHCRRCLCANAIYLLQRRMALPTSEKFQKKF